MKRLLLIFLIGFSVALKAQSYADSIKQHLKEIPRDSNYVKFLQHLAELYYFTKPDSCKLYYEQALDLSRQIQYKKGEVTSLNAIAECLRFLGDYPASIRMNFEALRINREMKDKRGEGITLGFIGFTYLEFREISPAMNYLKKSYEIVKNYDPLAWQSFTLSNIGYGYEIAGKYDSALLYSKMAQEKWKKSVPGPLRSLVFTRTGNAYAGMNNPDSAFHYYFLALDNVVRINDGVNASKVTKKIAELFERMNKNDSALFYARTALASAKNSSQNLELYETAEILSRLFHKQKNIDSALFYKLYAGTLRDSLYGPDKLRQQQLLMLAEQQKQQDAVSAQERYKQKTRITIMFLVSAVLLLLGFFSFKNFIQQKKAKEKVQKAYSELKQTQAQLIQAEKMASLGELTAGIAHEIQNPLNFVNNFSEINQELLSELKQEIAQNNLEKVNDLSTDVIENEKKISHHGKRADAIVKSMLQHSRTNTGQKELIDINALAEEYVRLAYHGMRAKDKGFNAELKTHFDPFLPGINAAPQDIGRVFVNLLNNAFQAVSEKMNSGTYLDYKPIVTVRTKKENGRISILIGDNGMGIGKKNLEKIFQPFFTTRPTGQGTGLGLSLSYDIITKTHGGSLKVNTKEGEGSEFVIELPVS